MRYKNGYKRLFNRWNKRLNDNLEKTINKGNGVNNEPEQIVKNVLAMCKIAELFKI